MNKISNYQQYYKFNNIILLQIIERQIIKTHNTKMAPVPGFKIKKSGHRPPLYCYDTYSFSSGKTHIYSTIGFL